MHNQETEYISKKQVIIILSLVTLFHLINVIGVFKGAMPNGGDTGTHYQLLQETVRSLKGEPWWDNAYQLGFPMFLFYAPLPYLAVGLVHIITFIPLLFLFKLSILLFFLSFPLIIYQSARLFNFTKLHAVIAAAISLLFSSEFGFGIEHRVMFDFGLYSQLWGLLFLPLALGYSYQYFIESKPEFLWKTLLFSFLTFTSHLFLGIILILAMGILILAGHKITKELMKKSLLFGIVFLISISFFVIPYLINKEYYGGLNLDDPLRNNGYGITETLKFFITGKLFDYRSVVNISILTLLVLGSLILFTLKKEHRQDSRLRFLIYCLLISLFFIAGKKSFNFINYIPIINELQTFRFIALLHFSAIFLVSWLVTLMFNFTQGRIAKTLVRYTMYLILIIILLLPYIDNIYAYTFHTTPDITFNSDNYFEIAEQLKALPDNGRIKIDITNMPRAITFINSFPVFTNKAQTNGNGIGYHDSLNTYYLGFPKNFPFNYSKLFNIQYQLERDNATKKYVIKPEASDNYIELGHARYVLYTTPKEARGINLLWSWSGLPLYNEYFIISKNPEVVEKYIEVNIKENKEFVVKTINPEGKSTTSIQMDKAPLVKLHDEVKRGDGFIKSLKKDIRDCGDVITETATKGHYTAEIEAVRDDCLVILKATYHPDWEAKIDGNKTKTYEVSPSYIAIDAPRGKHTVVFTFKISWLRKALIMISLLSLVLTYWILRKKEPTKNGQHGKEKNNNPL
ncbi:YfhO family protein [Candidatus Woesearchaeota archaeon]|nr:YfhO family protein [Candidatus Woesearchaeota archaeon]